jgi:hypothetical protein
MTDEDDHIYFHRPNPTPELGQATPISFAACIQGGVPWAWNFRVFQFDISIYLQYNSIYL